MNSKEIVGSVFAVALKIVIAVIVIMLVYKYAIMAYDYGYRVFGEEPVSSGEGKTVTVTIDDGMSVKEIGKMLENNGLIRDAKLFVIQEKVSAYKDMIAPGVYELNTSMSVENMLEAMAEQPSTQEEELSTQAEQPSTQEEEQVESQ